MECVLVFICFPQAITLSMIFLFLTTKEGAVLNARNSAVISLSPLYNI